MLYISISIQFPSIFHPFFFSASMFTQFHPLSSIIHPYFIHFFHFHFHPFFIFHHWCLSIFALVMLSSIYNPVILTSSISESFVTAHFHVTNLGALWAPYTPVIIVSQRLQKFSQISADMIRFWVYKSSDPPQPIDLLSAYLFIYMYMYIYIYIYIVCMYLFLYLYIYLQSPAVILITSTFHYFESNINNISNNQSHLSARSYIIN